MKHLTASTSPSPFSGENWFDPLEDAIRFRVRAFIEAVVAEEAQAALGGRARYQRSGAPKGYRNGHRHRQLVGTFGALTVSLPRVRLLDGDGGEKEWRSQTIQAYKRLTKRAEAIIANTYLAGTNTRRVRRALAGLFGGKVGKDAVSRAWRKVKTDWESWQARDLSGEDIVRLILDGMMYAENAEQVRKKRKAFLAKWRLRCRGVADSLEEAGERLFTFLRYPPQQWKSLRTTNAIERLHGEFKRRVKTQCALPNAETAAMLFWALMASGQITMRRVGGWQTLDQAPVKKPIDLAA